MPRIKKLPLHEAQKIAAGEVVERPANVVKELLENSIDAQATHITLYLEQAGKQLIRIVDDGCGMSPEDAYLCIERHATSKITSVEQLYSLTTFGFRGEALASIAAVGKLTLATKEASAEHGIQLTIEQNAIVQEQVVSCNTGTDISIRDLFYNIPARKKFLKTDDTEWRQIQLLVQAYCLDNISIHFKLFHNGNLVLNCPPTDSLMNRIAQVWDHTFAQQMLNIHAAIPQESLTISGVISQHQYARYDRSMQFFFVNQRWIKNSALGKALIKAYMNILPQGQYPAAFIFIELDHAAVDINIHPRKEEVQFLHPRRIETLLQTAAKERLEEYLSHQLGTKEPQSKNNWVSDPQPVIPQPAISTHNRPSHQNPIFTFNFDQPAFSVEDESPILPEQKHSSPPLAYTNTTIPSYETPREQEQQQVLLETSQKRSYAIIGQLNKTYILLEKEDGLFLVDQHAAHERILYELFTKRFEQVATITLLFPITITLTKDAIKTIEPYLDLLRNNGIVIDIFSQTELIIQATPVYLKDVPLDDSINQFLGWIIQYQHLDKEALFKELTEKLHAQMACKAAVKAGDVLTMEHMQELIDQLNTTQNRLTCPHGRPTGWLISTYEIERKFKRKN